MEAGMAYDGLHFPGAGFRVPNVRNFYLVWNN